MEPTFLKQFGLAVQDDYLRQAAQDQRSSQGRDRQRSLAALLGRLAGVLVMPWFHTVGSRKEFGWPWRTDVPAACRSHSSQMEE